MKRMVILSTLVCAGMCSGCGVFDKKKDGDSVTLKSRGLAHHDYKDATDEEDEHSYMRDYARGDRATEKDPDTFFRKYGMSSKARGIERNLGIE